MCQNAYINGVDDFCLWAPPTPGPGSGIGSTERIEVAWCTKSGYGTRLIPDGTLQGVHFVETPDFVQITGIGDLTKLNVPAGDQGGELDPHGADGNGNPIGGLVFSSVFGGMKQVHEWTNFMSSSEFCFRACKPGPKAAQMCQHIYDVMGCRWNMPANYDAGVFESCKGDSGQPMGVYGASTFHQGDPATPAGHPIPSSSQCQRVNTVSSGAQATLAPPSGSSSSSSASSNSTPSTKSTSSSASASASVSSQANSTSGGLRFSTGTAPLPTPTSNEKSASGSTPSPTNSTGSSSSLGVGSSGFTVTLLSVSLGILGRILL
jgi:hypothetical protein